MFKLITLPNDLGDAPKVVLGYFAGTITDHWELTHAAYHVAGFALAQFHDHPPVIGTAGVPMSEAEFKAVLRSFAEAPAKANNRAVDWKAVFFAALQLLAKLLLEKQQPAFGAAGRGSGHCGIRKGDVVRLKSDDCRMTPMTVEAVDCCGFAHVVWVDCDGDFCERRLHCSLLEICCDEACH